MSSGTTFNHLHFYDLVKLYDYLDIPALMALAATDPKRHDYCRKIAIYRISRRKCKLNGSEYLSAMYCLMKCRGLGPNSGRMVCTEYRQTFHNVFFRIYYWPHIGLTLRQFDNAHSEKFYADKLDGNIYMSILCNPPTLENAGFIDHVLDGKPYYSPIKLYVKGLRNYSELVYYSDLYPNCKCLEIVESFRFLARDRVNLPIGLFPRLETLRIFIFCEQNEDELFKVFGRHIEIVYITGDTVIKTKRYYNQ